MIFIANSMKFNLKYSYSAFTIIVELRIRLFTFSYQGEQAIYKFSLYNNSKGY